MKYGVTPFSVVLWELDGNGCIRIQLHRRFTSIVCQYFPRLEGEAVCAHSHTGVAEIQAQLSSNVISTWCYSQLQLVSSWDKNLKKKRKYEWTYPTCRWARWPDPLAWAPVWLHGAPRATGRTRRRWWGLDRAAVLTGSEDPWDSARGNQTSHRSKPEDEWRLQQKLPETKTRYENKSVPLFYKILNTMSSASELCRHFMEDLIF